ncbi:gp57 [Alphaproteobacteria phage PhiJL001]|uniref:Gp57 n=1 Tax=Alphaproteobacteria phage PhiJL001 TaxID=2681607 RepID=Q5DN48_9CAUD|nr:gp57 [Alphaproteobacteria phage PhiJL001]AAT69533.1 gp57 [Alphaproteobacteria phage PhiJL001]
MTHLIGIVSYPPHPQSPYFKVHVPQCDGVPLSLKAMRNGKTANMGDVVIVNKTKGGYKGWETEEVVGSTNAPEPSTLAQVAEFHTAFKCSDVDFQTPEEAHLLGEWEGVLQAQADAIKEQARRVGSVRLLRLQLLLEEVAEVSGALAADDPEHILKELSDVQYVLDGAYISLRLAAKKDAAFALVHQSNMTKLQDGEPRKHGSGRVEKGDGYVPADLSGLFKD